MKAEKTRTLGVWMNGERVGSWIWRSRQSQSFVYADSWLASPLARPISLSIPFESSGVSTWGPQVEAFFDNLLPDNADIRRRIQRRFGCVSDSPFDLLSEIGRDCVGALQLLPEDREPPSVCTIESEPLKESDVARLLRAVTSDVVLGAFPEDSFRISIAGAQEKTALLLHNGGWCKPIGTTPTSHIFKFPLGRIGTMQADMSTSIENEWLCLQILEAFGLGVAKAEIAAFEDQKVLVVERFDRSYSPDGSWLMRIPQEDLCQATGTPPSQKYENEGGPGFLSLMDLLLGAREPLNDRKKFMKAQVLFWLLAAPDGHAKNFSIFLEPKGRFSLTPFYDVMSVYPILGYKSGNLPPEKLRMAMAVIGKNRHYEWLKIQNRHWISTAECCGARKIMEDVIAEIVDAIPAVTTKIESILPPDFPENIAQAILSGVEATGEKLGCTS